MDKRPYKKTTRVVNSKAMGAEFGYDLPSHNFEMWSDPANDVWSTLWEVAVLREPQLEDMRTKEPKQWKDLNDRYLNAVSELIIDCDIEGVDFSTPENVTIAFNRPGVDSRFFYIVISLYCMQLLAIRRGLVKVSGPASNASASTEEPAASPTSS